MKLYPQTSPDSVQAWTQEDFGFSVDSKAGLESALENMFPAGSPAPSSSTAAVAASSSFAELKPVPPLKALTQCDYVGSSAESSYYPAPEPGPSSSQDLVSTTTSGMGESVMMKPAEPGSIDTYMPSDMADDDFAAIIGNAMVDPQLSVPDNLELGNFTSSDMQDLEAWIEGQSQAQLQRYSAASSSGSSTLHYSTSSPMLQNLLAGNGCTVTYPASPAPPPCYTGLLQHRLQKPLITYSPPTYSSLPEALPLGSQAAGGAVVGSKKRRPPTVPRPTIKMPIATEGTKDRPVHRCTICNRGFLNKSNIKVHLRTHTGEKPFKCETCCKAFRQKAHLLKHYHIHKRLSRD